MIAVPVSLLSLLLPSWLEQPPQNQMNKSGETTREAWIRRVAFFHGSDTHMATDISFSGSIAAFHHQTDLLAPKVTKKSLTCDFELSIKPCHEMQYTVA